MVTTNPATRPFEVVIGSGIDVRGIDVLGQIFEPLDEKDNKSLMYAPFQTMAQYYISLGYAGIIYGSTVSKTGKNIVLFDKTTAHPVGAIEDYRIL